MYFCFSFLTICSRSTSLFAKLSIDRRGQKLAVFVWIRLPPPLWLRPQPPMTGVMVHYNVLSNEEKKSTLLGQRRTWLRNLGKVVRPLSGIVSLPFVMQTQKLLEFFTLMKGWNVFVSLINVSLYILSGIPYLDDASLTHVSRPWWGGCGEPTWCRDRLHW